MKIEDLYQIHYLGNLQLSPAKDKLSYVDIIADKNDDNYKANIYLRDLKSGQTIRLTSNGKERSYKWLDEHTVVFVSNRDDKLKELKQPWTVFYKIDVCGGEATEYFRTPISVGDFYFMENGKIAATCSINYKEPFFTLKEEERAEYDKKQKEKASVEVFTDAPFWANGAGIIDGNRSIVAIIDPKDGQITPITPLEDESHICDVKGNRILYLRHVTDGLRSITNGLFEYDEKENVIVEEAQGHCNFAKYVGDGVVYDYATFEKYGLHQHGDIYIYRDGQITAKLKHDNTYGSYIGSDVIQQFSDGMIKADDALYFLEVATDRSSLRKLSLDGLMETIYENDEEIDDIAFTGKEFYFLANDTSHLVELYRFDGKEKTKLSSYHDALVDKGIGEVERIAFHNDGIELYGFVMKPTGFDPDKKYPAILNVHGGPKGVDGPAFKYGAQAVADRGYFVFYTNPRGADGRGNEFADIRGRFGKEDYDDLMAFTDAVLKAYPQIDATKLGVTGLSYGGYMTNWIITQTDRFACAIAEASISNYVTKFLCTDIGFTYNISNQAADPWSDIDLVWEQSPLKYANQVKTPTMFIHSDGDYRCWIAEGIQMYTALKMHHVKTKFMLFHGEHHGMSLFGSPSHRTLRLESMLDWFDEHLA